MTVKKQEGAKGTAVNRQELEQCVHEYGKELYAFCCRLTPNQAEADDLYQDTFLKAVELQEQIEANRNPRSYLISIALRIWKNRRRKAAWRSRIAGEIRGMEEAVLRTGTTYAGGTAAGFADAVPAGFADAAPAGFADAAPTGFADAVRAGFSETSPVEETVLDSERVRLVRDCVAALPERYRIPVYLYYTANLPVRQIAKMLRLPDGTVKSRLHKARKLLKARLEGVLDEI